MNKSVKRIVSNLRFKGCGDKSMRVDIGTSEYSSASILDTRANVNGVDRTRVDLKLSRAFANDKIIVTVGSDIDFNLGSSAIQSGTTQWLPNINIEFILSRDRKLRLIVLNKSSLDLNPSSFGRRSQQGVSIHYRKDF